MAEDLFIATKELSKEEKKYEYACGLQDAMECVLRFECKVDRLRSAAQKFQSLGDYKDAKDRKVQCEHEAERILAEECEEVFQTAIRLQENATNKSDYVEAIAEFKRTKKNPAYEQKAKNHISQCRSSIARIQKKAALKRYAIAFVSLIILGFLFTRTSAYPFVKGLIYEQRGEYKRAITQYKIAKGIPWAEGKMRESYYQLGLTFLQVNDNESAMKCFRKAEHVKGADIEIAKLEQKQLAALNPGDVIRFGKNTWIILDKKDGEALLLLEGNGTRRIIHPEECVDWEETELCTWLNTKFLISNFSNEERMLIHSKYGEKISIGEEHVRTYLTLLSTEEYKKYRDIILSKKENWWLHGRKMSAMEADYVTSLGEVKQTYTNNTSCFARPAMWVDFQ